MPLHAWTPHWGVHTATGVWPTDGTAAKACWQNHSTMYSMHPLSSITSSEMQEVQQEVPFSFIMSGANAGSRDLRHLLQHGVAIHSVPSSLQDHLGVQHLGEEGESC